jgi:hypothetical protein
MPIVCVPSCVDHMRMNGYPTTYGHTVRIGPFLL